MGPATVVLATCSVTRLQRRRRWTRSRTGSRIPVSSSLAHSTTDRAGWNLANPHRRHSILRPTRPVPGTDGATLRDRARSPSGHRERLLSTISHTLCRAGPSPPRALDARGLPVSEAATRAFAATLGRNASKNVSFGPIEQRTTPGSVAHVLRTAILDGTLAPGSQLREIPLAADLGVSRAPLREALGILADEGLIVKYPYRGAFVAEVSATGMSEIAS